MPIGNAAVFRIAAHHRNDSRILLRLIFPDDLVLVGEVERIDRVRKRCMHVHRVADDERSAFIAPHHPGPHRPPDLQPPDLRPAPLPPLRAPPPPAAPGPPHPPLRLPRHL